MSGSCASVWVGGRAVGTGATRSVINGRITTTHRVAQNTPSLVKTKRDRLCRLCRRADARRKKKVQRETQGCAAATVWRLQEGKRESWRLA